ncbi:MAG TPA: hypothetical protein VI139_05985 [Gemmatimonadales bacterium]
MKQSRSVEGRVRVSVRVVAFAVIAACVACRDVPQAPNPPAPPEPPAFAIAHVDHVNPLSDCCGLIAEPNLFVDGAGSVHLLYGAWDVGAVRYAGCAAACNAAGSWRIGEVDSSFLGIGDGGQMAAALTSSGIHLLYQSATANGQTALLSYGWCPGACYLKAAWQTRVIDTMADVLAEPGGASAVLDAAGVLHAVYEAPSGLRYAECSLDCSNQGSWRFATLDAPGTLATATAIAVGGDGRVHVLYPQLRRGDTLSYATCASACSDSANWQLSGVFWAPAGAVRLPTSLSLAVGPDNRLHALYVATQNLSNTAVLTYLSCAVNCASSSAWQNLVLDTTRSGASIAIGADGAAHVAYVNHGVRYARCDSACLSPGAWTRQPVDSTLGAWSLAIALDANGKPVIAMATSFDVYVALMR